MLDPLLVLNRFGDEEFLRELWLRARRQLPLELEAVERQGAEDGELGKRLHKLRGLIANFLEGGEAISLLRRCEQLCRQHQDRLPRDCWDNFRLALEQEIGLLEGWLGERGFPCD